MYACRKIYEHVNFYYVNNLAQMSKETETQKKKKRGQQKTFYSQRE